MARHGAREYAGDAEGEDAARLTRLALAREALAALLADGAIWPRAVALAKAAGEEIAEMDLAAGVPYLRACLERSSLEELAVGVQVERAAALLARGAIGARRWRGGGGSGGREPKGGQRRGRRPA